MRKVFTSLMLLMLFIINTAAIIYHDVPDEAYRELASNYPAFKEDATSVDATLALPDDIDISTSPNGIVDLPNSVHEDWIDGGFVKYTKIVAPNGKAIHFVAQDLLTDAQIVRSRNILQFFLTDYPGSQYGSDKSAVANKMTENNATLALMNGTHISGVNEPNVPAQCLFQNEIAVEGHEWYINNDFSHRDAAFEEILHLFQDAGIGVDGELNTQPGVLPAYQAEIRAAVNHGLANNLYGIDDPDYIEEISSLNNLTQEYFAAVVDTYYGLWAPWTEGNGAIWGIYIAKTREEIKSRDPMGYALMPKLFSPYIHINMDIDPSFSGIFNMTFNASQPYTHKSQYLQHCTLTGTNASGLKGNDIDNELNGNSADNSLEGGKGNDRLDGKGGTDIVIFTGNFVDYTITNGADNSVTVTDKVANRNGMDLLYNIENLQFADGIRSTSTTEPTNPTPNPSNLTEQQDVFQEFWDIYDDYYPLFHQKNIDWEAVYDTYSSRVTATTTDAQLFGILSEIMTTVLKDGHSHIAYNGGESVSYEQEASAEMQNMLSNNTPKQINIVPSSANNPYISYGTLVADPDIGYINSKRFEPVNDNDFDVYKAIVDEALNALQSKKGIIVDVRTNGGGQGRYAFYLAGRFFATNTPTQIVRKRVKEDTGSSLAALTDWLTEAFEGYEDDRSEGGLVAETIPSEDLINASGSFQFTNKVALLTGVETASAAEWFTGAMKTQAHVKSFGETTFGIFAGSEVMTLESGDGKWETRLSIQDVEILYNGTYQALEGIGITPDEVLPPTAAQVASGKDIHIDAAIGYIGTGATNNPTTDPINPDPANLTEQQAVFQEYWDIYDLYYPLFPQKNIDWQNVYDTYFPRITATTTDAQLLAIFKEINVTILKDGHSYITLNGDRENAAEFFIDDSEEILSMIIDNTPNKVNYVASSVNDPYISYGTLVEDPDIGFIHTKTFEAVIQEDAEINNFKASVDKALNALQSKKGIIIDARIHGGGQPLFAYYLAGRFVATTDPIQVLRTRVKLSRGSTVASLSDWLTETFDGFEEDRSDNGLIANFDPSEDLFKAAGPFQYTNKVALLTARGTGSAAEAFTGAMKTQAHVKTIGEITQGIFSGIEGVTLNSGGGKWKTIMSIHDVETLYNGTYQAFEGIGIPPDELLIPTAAQVADGREIHIEAALRYFNDGATTEPTEPTTNPQGPRTAEEELAFVRTKARSVVQNDLGYWEAEFGDGIVMIFVPAGSFTIGNDALTGDVTDSYLSAPAHQVSLDYYWISKTPITTGQFRKFVAATNYVTDVEKPENNGPYVLVMPNATHFEPKKGRNWRNAFQDVLDVYPEIEINDNHPVSCVSWNDAIAYTDWLVSNLGLSFSLPTEAEWEYAARGTDGRVYPWGNQIPDGTRANYADETMNRYFPDLEQAFVHRGVTDGYALTSPVGSFPNGRSPIGALDMAGNLTEWVFDVGYDYTASPKNNPIYTEGDPFRLQKAGFWSGSAGRFGVEPNEIAEGHNIRADARQGSEPNSGDDHLGFRIAISYTSRNGNDIADGGDDGTRSPTDNQNVCFMVEPNPNSSILQLSGFTKYVNVFGLGVYAEAGISDEKVLHTAAVLAEYLDNNEDGTIDDPKLYNKLLELNMVMPIMDSADSPAAQLYAEHESIYSGPSPLYDNQIVVARPIVDVFDTTLEEVIHNLHAVGYGEAYPELFSDLEDSNSALNQAMDIARGGHFTTIPNPYPDGAWYTYDDETCDYDCMSVEYFYWGLSSLLGMNDFGNRCAEINEEWRPCTPAQFQETDTRLYNLFTNPSGYVIPTVAPDGRYCPTPPTPPTAMIDADNDGILAENDCNDNDASVGAKQPVGTACNDGNTATENDVVTADGCTCAGTAIGNTGTKDWTLLVYLNGSDLETKSGEGTSDLAEMMAAGNTDNVNIIVLTGGAKKAGWETLKSWKIENGNQLPLNFQPVDNNMANPQNLTNFISWAIENYPANKYMLDLWNHGMDIRGYGHDENTDQEIKIPQLKQAIGNSSFIQGGNRFELLGFDACLMATIEVEATLANFTNYFVASEETEPGHGWDYMPVITALNNGQATNGAVLGTIIADAFKAQAAAKQTENVTLSVVNAAQLPPLVDALENLSNVIIDDGAAALRGLQKARSKAEEYSPSIQNPEESEDMVDIGDMMKNLKKADPFLKNAADQVLMALNNAVVYSVNDQTRPNATGLSMFIPHNKLENEDAVFDAIDNHYDPIAFSEPFQSFVAGDYLNFALGDDSPPQGEIFDDGDGLKGHHPTTRSSNPNSVFTSVRVANPDDLEEVRVILESNTALDGGEILLLGSTFPDTSYTLEDGSEVFGYFWDEFWLGINGYPAYIADIYEYEVEEENGDTTYRTRVQIPAVLNPDEEGEGRDIIISYVFDDDFNITLENIVPETYGDEVLLTAKERITLQPGDRIQLTYEVFNEITDEDSWAIDTEAIFEIVNGEEDLSLDYELVEEGEYVLGFLLTDYSQNDTIILDQQTLSVVNSTVESFAANNIELLPNPTTGNLTINYPAFSGGTYRVELYDLAGQLSYQQVFDAATANLELGDLSNGYYLVKLISEDKIFSDKVIIMK